MYIVGQWRHVHYKSLVVHGHGRAMCAVAFVACVRGDECSTFNVVLCC